MLVLARKISERIMIGEDIEVSIIDIRGDSVKIGIEAPKTVKVYRKEVFTAIQEENKAAAASATQLPRLDDIIK
jgi:carbon storage regulator